MENRGYTPFGKQIRVITTDGTRYLWNFEDHDDQDSSDDEEPGMIPFPRPIWRGGCAPGRGPPPRRHYVPARENGDPSRPASIFDYPNPNEYEDDNNNNDQFPNLNENHFNENVNVVTNEPHDELQNESSESDDNWSESDEDPTEIECRRCNRIYRSGILFVRTMCNHLTCVSCMWEHAINFGINICPICGGIIDYTETTHVDDIASGSLRYRNNNNN